MIDELTSQLMLELGENQCPPGNPSPSRGVVQSI